MNKIYMKLIALSLTLAVSVTMVVAVSYAWMVLSNQPEVAGIQVTIGGRNTILVAPDVTGQDDDGNAYHHPGEFVDNLNFSLYENYEYLNELGSLMPVSTADGIHWFMPEYYTDSDEAVRKGLAAAGQIKEVADFTWENDLSHANLDAATSDDTLYQGHYAYLDFWVVSPSADCTLRLSVPTVDGDNSGGSFLVERMEAEEQDGKVVLVDGNTQAVAMARVGFLTNPYTLTDNSMVRYVNSEYFDNSYRSLRGWYSEPGEYAMNFEENRFTIYEPNADYHPAMTGMNGTYIPTLPVGLEQDVPTAVSVREHLMVQQRSSWIKNENGQTVLEQIFQSAIYNKTGSAEELSDYFYHAYLQGQVDHYVQKGKFVEKSSDLLQEIKIDGIVPTAGATEDVYIIRLERNIPQRIRMFVWLEGQDADCVNLTDGGAFVLNLELAGSTAKETAG